MGNVFRRIRQTYGDMKLQTKLTISLLLAVTIPVLMLGAFFYGKLYDMVVSYTIRQEQDASAKTSPLIEETVQKVVDTSSAFSTLPFYKKLFHQPVNSPMSTLAESAQAQEFVRQVQKITDQEPITRIRVYIDWPNEKSPLFASPSTGEVFAPFSQIKGTYWYGIFQGTGASELYCPSFYLGAQEQTEYGDMAYIRSGSLYYHGVSYKTYVAVYYSSATLTSVLSENLALEGSVSYIINERDNLVASSDSSLSGIYWLSYGTIEDSFTSSNNFIERTILDSKIYAGFYRINKPGWFMVTVLPSGPLIDQSNQIMVQYVILYLVFLALALFLSTLSARSITGRISSVSNQMKTVRQGPPVPMESPAFHDEVGDLIDTYNYMTRQLNQLLENQAKAAEDLRIAEFNSLQAQINPHFLYNTMDMINWMALQGRTSEISNAVQSLSRFYKLTLSRKQSISTIAQEDEHVSIYVHLQNMRYHDNIEFISDVPDELMEYQIPKLTLQPVVENAILHGILEKPSKSGTIVLTGWMEGEDIILLISDDGVGIAPEKMPTILSGTGQSASGGTNIAIYNTHRRLQILYGENYGLSYSSVPGEGTEVQIRIPAKRESHLSSTEYRKQLS
ncbi:sensor histidine kinase [Ruminococcus sp. 5_1_39BFAA]|uniref:sensor histidine kinase n=1 Tax=Ruminococcus sp. 5_1_39BFAA TaxID=457412 RepID=UPI003566A9AE